MRSMYRYVVPVDDRAHTFRLSGNPVAVAVVSDDLVEIASEDLVEFWAEHDGDGTFDITRAFQVFGTGHALPPGARWRGTCSRTKLGLVWHLYEVA